MGLLNMFICCFRKKNKISPSVLYQNFSPSVLYQPLSDEANYVDGYSQETVNYSKYEQITLPHASSCNFKGLDYLRIVTADSARECSISNCPNIKTIKGKSLEELRITGKCNIENIEAPNLKKIMIVDIYGEELELFKKQINASLLQDHKVQIDYGCDTVVDNNKVQPQADDLSRFSPGAGVSRAM